MLDGLLLDVAFPDAGLVDALSKLGAGALLVLGILGLLSRRVRTAGEVAEIERVCEERLAELRVDRDEWRGVAKASLAKVDRLTDVVETFTGTKIAP